MRITQYDDIDATRFEFTTEELAGHAGDVVTVLKDAGVENSVLTVASLVLVAALQLRNGNRDGKSADAIRDLHSLLDVIAKIMKDKL